MADTATDSVQAKKLTTKQTADKTWLRIVIALAAGITCGLLFGKDSPLFQLEHQSTLFITFQYAGTAILSIADPVGHLFINAIKMMVIPVVFVSIVCGVISFQDPKLMGSVGLKTLLVYLVTMAIAILIGIGLAKLIHPGHFMPGLKTLDIASGKQHIETVSLKNLIVSLIPESPVQAFAEANVLQTVVFAIIFGMAIIYSKEKGESIATLFKNFSLVIQQIPRIIMRFAPIGVFALMTTVTATYGPKILSDLFSAVLAIYLGCMLQLVLVYSVIIKLLGLSVRQFYKKMLTAMTFAFSTTSSAATLPYTQAAATRLGVSKRMTNFIIPMGATMNMNGLSVYLGVATVFAANIMQVELASHQLLMVVATGTFAAIGAAGVPGSALIVMSLVLGSVGFSTNAIALVIGLFAGVDRVIDMATTTVNISGDTIAAMIVSNSEGELDHQVFQSDN